MCSENHIVQWKNLERFRSFLTHYLSTYLLTGYIFWNKLLFLVYSEWNDNENIYTKNSKQPEVKIRKATTIKSRKNANLVKWAADKMCVLS